MNRHEILYQLPMIQGWAFICWSIENDPNFTGDRRGNGYIFQGAKALLDKSTQP